MTIQKWGKTFFRHQHSETVCFSKTIIRCSLATVAMAMVTWHRHTCEWCQPPPCWPCGPKPRSNMHEETTLHKTKLQGLYPTRKNNEPHAASPNLRILCDCEATCYHIDLFEFTTTHTQFFFFKPWVMKMPFSSRDDGVLSAVMQSHRSCDHSERYLTASKM